MHADSHGFRLVSQCDFIHGILQTFGVGGGGSADFGVPADIMSGWLSSRGLGMGV